MRFTRRFAASAAALIVTVAAGAATVNATGIGDAQRAQNFAAAPNGTDQSAPVSNPSERLGALAAFERSRVASDVPPTNVVTPEARERGAQTAEARRLFSTSEDTVYAIPVVEGVCLSSASYVVQMCLPDVALPADAGADALRGFQSSICSPYMDPDQIALFGLLPDGLTDLRFVRADGSEFDIPLSGNFAYYTFAKTDTPPVSASWQNASGETFSAPLPLPEDAGTTQCDTSQTPSEARSAAKRKAVVAATRN